MLVKGSAMFSKTCLVFFILAFGYLSYADEADNQPLTCLASHHGLRDPITNHRGVELPSLTATLTAGGQNGPVLLQDSNLLDHLAHFNRERIPERVVHAKGGGAFGTFEVTHDISRWTKAEVFSQVGARIPVLVRFSLTIAESGGADTERDGRGFAVKFYTDAGNWDLVGNNLPVFPIRDPILFPSLIRSRKRNPATHLHNENSFWDFNSLRPETTHHTMMLFSDLGTPDGFRFQNGFGVHTFKFVNASGAAFYVKFHWVSNQGLKNLSSHEAARLKGDDPDYALRDLYNAIEVGKYPSWNLFVQIMEFAEAETYQWNPFDITKVWLIKDFPLIPVGRMTLNKNPTDYFTQIEQAAFSPSHMIPGIEPSPDRMLQGRLFAYPDTIRYRLGVNFLQLPVNRPNPSVKVNTYQKDGFMCSTDNGRGAPNYYPNSFGGPAILPNNNASESIFPVDAEAKRQDVGLIDNYSQADIFWKTELNSGQRDRLVQNLAESIATISSFEVQSRVLSKMFDPVNSEISSMLRSRVRREIINKNSNKRQ